MVLRTSKTQKNPNRRYFSCPRKIPGDYQSKDCGFFEWIDPQTNLKSNFDTPAGNGGGGAAAVGVAVAVEVVVEVAAAVTTNALNAVRRVIGLVTALRSGVRTLAVSSMALALTRHLSTSLLILNPIGIVTTMDLYLEARSPNGQATTSTNGTAAAAASQERSNYNLLAFFEEDTTFSALMDACKSACDKGVHDHCFQMDGTRHITLADYRGLTKAEADAVQFAEPHQLPLHLPIAGFHNWVDKSACLALKVYGGDTLLSATPLLLVCRLMSLKAARRSTISTSRSTDAAGTSLARRRPPFRRWSVRRRGCLSGRSR